MYTINGINSNTEEVIFICLLHDKRLAATSMNRTIQLFNPYNDYKCEYTYPVQTRIVYSLCQLPNGNIISTSFKNIKVWSVNQPYDLLFSIEKAHNDWAYKAINIPNNLFVTCSKDCTIKIWKGIQPYNEIPIKVLEGHHSEVKSIVELNNKIISVSNDRTLKIWNIYTYQCESIITGLYCFHSNGICIFDDYRIVIGENNRFYVVNILQCMIEDKIEDHELSGVYSIAIVNDEVILCGCYHIYCLYNVKKKQIINKTKTLGCLTIHDILHLETNKVMVCVDGKGKNILTLQLKDINSNCMI